MGINIDMIPPLERIYNAIKRPDLNVNEFYKTNTDRILGIASIYDWKLKYDKINNIDSMEALLKFVDDTNKPLSFIIAKEYPKLYKNFQWANWVNLLI